MGIVIIVVVFLVVTLMWYRISELYSIAYCYRMAFDVLSTMKLNLFISLIFNVERKHTRI